eukprot:gene5148-3698_t
MERHHGELLNGNDRGGVLEGRAARVKAAIYSSITVILAVSSETIYTYFFIVVYLFIYFFNMILFIYYELLLWRSTTLVSTLTHTESKNDVAKLLKCELGGRYTEMVAPVFSGRIVFVGSNVPLWVPRAIECRGGRVTRELDGGAVVYCGVCNALESNTLLARLVRRRRVTIVSPAWVRECVDADTLFPLREIPGAVLFDPLLFRGLRFTTTQLPRQIKHNVIAAVRFFGGSYSPELATDTDLLIFCRVLDAKKEVRGASGSKKLLAASRHKITCVTPMWVQRCIDAGRLLDRPCPPILPAQPAQAAILRSIEPNTCYTIGSGSSFAACAAEMAREKEPSAANRKRRRDDRSLGRSDLPDPQPLNSNRLRTPHSRKKLHLFLRCSHASLHSSYHHHYLIGAAAKGLLTKGVNQGGSSIPFLTRHCLPPPSPTTIFSKVGHLERCRSIALLSSILYVGLQFIFLFILFSLIMFQSSPRSLLLDRVMEYADKIIPRNEDMKVLLVDETTLHVISMAFTQTELLSRKVFLVDKVENTQQRSPMKLMRCILFIRPESSSVDAACEELQRGKYKSYAVVFCCATCPEHLDRLAYADCHNLVDTVLEVFCDFCTVNNDAFLIEKAGTSSLFSSNTDAMRVAEGIASLMAAQKCVPIIRYQGRSETASRVAADLVDILRHDQELYNFPTRDTVLLIVDRSDDPLTPLMTPWTYQAMLHEHVGIQHNVVYLPGDGVDDEAKQLVVSAKDDPLFAENMFRQWGEVCVNVKAAVDRCKEVVSVDRSAASMEDLQMLLQSVPESRSMTLTATKHVALASHMSEMIKRSCLLEVSLLEQQMYSSSSPGDHWTRLVALANRCSIAPHHILRLCLIYNLRYEPNAESSKTHTILQQLGGECYTEKLKQLRKQCGDKSAVERLFPESNLVKSVMRTLKADDGANAYAQHQPLLQKTFLELLTGKLNETTYCLSAASRKQFSSTQRVKNVWVFICGGFTFEEAAFVHRVNSGAVKWEGPGAETASNRPLKCLIGGDREYYNSNATSGIRTYRERLCVKSQQCIALPFCCLPSSLSYHCNNTLLNVHPLDIQTLVLTLPPALPPFFFLFAFRPSLFGFRTVKGLQKSAIRHFFYAFSATIAVISVEGGRLHCLLLTRQQYYTRRAVQTGTVRDYRPQGTAPMNAVSVSTSSRRTTHGVVLTSECGSSCSSADDEQTGGAAELPVPVPAAEMPDAEALLDTYRSFPIVRLITALPASLAPCHSMEQRAVSCWSSEPTASPSTRASPLPPRHPLQKFFDPHISHHVALRPKGYLRHRLRSMLALTRANLAARSPAEAVLLELLLQKVLEPQPPPVATGEESGAYPQEEAAADRRIAEPPLLAGDEEADDSSLTTAEKLLYVILSTSVVANTANPAKCGALAETHARKRARWEGRPATQLSHTLALEGAYSLPRHRTFGAVPRCFLIPPTTALVEAAHALRRTMRWSCEVDPVVHATLVPEPHRLLAVSSAELLAPRRRGATAGPTRSNSFSSGWEGPSKVVAQLFRAPPAPTAEQGRHTDSAQLFVSAEALPPIQHHDVIPETAEGRGPLPHLFDIQHPFAVSPTNIFATFRRECSAELLGVLHMALHRCVVGVEDPYGLTVRQPAPGGLSSPQGGTAASLPTRLKRGFTLSNPVVSEPAIAVSREFESSRKRSKGERAAKRWRWEGRAGGNGKARRKRARRQPAFTRGLASLLHWGCECGTLVLRLERLCELAQLPERRPALGSYGQCGMDALRRAVDLVRRQAVELSLLPGGWKQLAFTDLLAARQRLEGIHRCVGALANVFGVTLGEGWDASQTLQGLSSAALLSRLYECFSLRTEMAQAMPEATRKKPFDGEPDDQDDEEMCLEFDAISYVLRAVMTPLHRMLHAWLTEGCLRDPLDEFFIVSSHGETPSGFTLDTSPHRLPSFLSADAAAAALNAGVALRALRDASAAVVALAAVCSNDHSSHPSPAAQGTVLYTTRDAEAVKWLIQDFLDALLGNGATLPTVDVLSARSATAYWRSFYANCNRALLGCAARVGLEEGRAGTSPTFLSSEKLEAHRQRQGTTASRSASPSGASHVMVVMSSADSSSALSEGQPIDALLLPRGPRSESSAASSATSRVSLALYGAISQEHRCASLAEHRSAASEQSSRALRDTFLLAARARRWRQRMEQWRQERKALQSLRLVAVATAVRDVRDAYEAMCAAHPEEGSGGPFLGRWATPLDGGLPTPRPPPVALFPSEAERPTVEARSRVRFAAPEAEAKAPAAVAPSQQPVDGPPPAPPAGDRRAPDQQRSQAEEVEESKTVEEIEPEETLQRQRTRSHRKQAGRGRVEEPVKGASLPVRRVTRIEPLPIYLSDDESSTAEDRSATVSVGVAEEVEVEPPAAGDPPLFVDGSGLAHYASMYVVQDINDEECFARRNGPRVAGAAPNTEEQGVATALREYAALQATVDINSPTYLAYCDRVASTWVQTAAAMGSPAVSSSSAAPASTAEHPSFFTPGTRAGLELTKGWGDDVAFFLGPEHRRQDTDGEAAEEAVVTSSIEHHKALTSRAAFLHCMRSLRLSSAQQRALQMCAAHYFRVSAHACSYLTHKALQMLLLPPYGPLYRVTVQLLDVCLLQSPSAAVRLMDWWLPHSQRMLEEGTAETADMVRHLNQVFREEWDKCVPGAGRTMWLEMHLQRGHGGAPPAPSPKRDSSAAGDGDLLPRWASDAVPEASEGGAYSNPVDFLNDLTVRCAGPSLLAWVLPLHALEDAGDLLCSLLLWKTVEQLVTHTWKTGLESHMADVFFFCNVARETFRAIQQHFWESLCSTSAAFRRRLVLGSPALYAYPTVESFTAEMAQFMNRCRYAALLTPEFIPCRRLLYGLLRVAEEVFQALSQSQKKVRQARDAALRDLEAHFAAEPETRVRVMQQVRDATRGCSFSPMTASAAQRHRRCNPRSVPTTVSRERAPSAETPGFPKEAARAVATIMAAQRSQREAMAAFIHERLALSITPFRVDLRRCLDQRPSRIDSFFGLQLLSQKLQSLQDALQLQMMRWEKVYLEKRRIRAGRTFLTHGSVVPQLSVELR